VLDLLIASLYFPFFRSKKIQLKKNRPGRKAQKKFKLFFASFYLA